MQRAPPAALLCLQIGLVSRLPDWGEDADNLQGGLGMARGSQQLTMPLPVSPAILHREGPALNMSVVQATADPLLSQAAQSSMPIQDKQSWQFP